VLPQETRQQARNGEGGLLALAASVAGCILECFYTLIEYLTKFATVMMSITGALSRLRPASFAGTNAAYIACSC
jgi:hypothetical protein